MLVIRRRAGQSIVIADGIEVQVIESGPHQVKLGIVAPREIAVARKEVLMTETENRRAAAHFSDALRQLKFLR